MSPFWILLGAQGDGGGDNNWSYKTCKASVKTSPPTNQHPTFTGRMPFLSPYQVVSEHWRERQLLNYVFQKQNRSCHLAFVDDNTQRHSTRCKYVQRLRVVRQLLTRCGSQNDSSETQQYNSMSAAAFAHRLSC